MLPGRKEGKTVVIGVSVTPTQKEIWERYAQKQNRCMSDFVRNGMNSYIAALQAAEKKRNGF
jgi:hypothetical protein